MKGYLTPSALSSLIAAPVLVAASVAALLTLSDAPVLYRYAAVLPLAYVMGALAWGYVVLLMHRGIDIRDYGSGANGSVQRPAHRRLQAGGTGAGAGPAEGHWRGAAGPGPDRRPGRRKWRPA